MAKPTNSTPDALAPTMNTATTPRGGAQKAAQPKPVPLQVRWPREDVKAVKVAAALAEQTISDFMLACFHAFMKKTK